MSTPALDETLVEMLRGSRNLLAFSGGIDSTALFFLLHDHDIAFDIAHVNYKTRAQSDAEQAYAEALAKRFGKRLYVREAPRIVRNFEAEARRFRYAFFEEIVYGDGYDTVLTAHQLNDKLEWLLMRLAKGAGIAELAGMQPVSYRDDYCLVRPLLQCSKEELRRYLDDKKERYFIDESNDDTRFERNRFRHDFSDALVAKYAKGIADTFRYLEKEAALLSSLYRVDKKIDKYYKIDLYDARMAPRAADAILKSEGYLLSAAERENIATQKSCVVGRKWAVERVDNLLYIAPYLRGVVMPKFFKEACRIERVPPKVRPYLYVIAFDSPASAKENKLWEELCTKA